MQQRGAHDNCKWSACVEVPYSVSTLKDVHFNDGAKTEESQWQQQRYTLHQQLQMRLIPGAVYTCNQIKGWSSTIM